MKSLLTVAAVLAGLAAPALAEEAATAPPPPQTQAALAPAQGGTQSGALPQSRAPQVVPMSAPLDANGPPPARSGCGHDKSTVYLTN